MVTIALGGCRHRAVAVCVLLSLSVLVFSVNLVFASEGQNDLNMEEMENNFVPVAGGPTFDLYQEFNTSSTITHEMKVGDIAGLLHEGEPHIITLEEIRTDSVVLTIQSDPFEVVINLFEKFNIDFDRDGLSDLSIILNSISEGEASLTFSKSPEDISDSPDVIIEETTYEIKKPGPEAEDTTETQEGPSSTGLVTAIPHNILLGAVFLIFIIIIAGWIFMKRRVRHDK